ncbi:hypothetical protein A4G99_11565 [Haladaptatus sp. R4]|uniref:DUF6498-containing protein n=1 Tax=Haladaptatus sp. R4 TaxID=1679489 RepID=UPI0007B4F34B|nr:DUF6498-containing protein [Haladaptatus sp. R4]KZN23536.1 hypothetical protein A4G99_11565 [Haladaptatus sp. R4]
MSERAQSAVRRLLSLLPVLVVNLFPLVGVFSFGWTATTVVALYWVEMGIVACWSIPKSLFARRVDVVSSLRFPLLELLEKRGGKSLWRGGPPAYVRNVPFAVMQVGILLFVWLAWGLFLLAQLDVGSALSPMVLWTVVIAGFGMAVGRGIEFRREYLGEKRYAEISPRIAQQATARHMVVFMMLLFVANTAGTRTASRFAVVVIVTIKLLTELYRFRSEYVRPDSGGLLGRFFSLDTGDLPSSVSAPSGNPDERFRPDSRAVFTSCLVPGLSGLVSRAGYLAILVTLLGMLVFGWVGVAVGLVSIVPIVLGKTLSYYALRGTVEYRRYDDELVAYDYWLDEPQWRIGLDELDGSSIPRQVTSRLLGTGVIRLDWHDGNERHRERLGPFGSVNDVADGLGLSATDADQKDPDRAVFVAAIGLTLMFLAVPVAAIASGSLPLGSVVILSLLLGAPCFVVIGALLWVAVMNC